LQLIAGHPRLRHLQQRRPYPHLVSDVQVLLQHASRRQILAKSPNVAGISGTCIRQYS